MRRTRRGEASKSAVLLTDDAAVRDLNRDWRGKDKPTNVLSFPASAPPGAPGRRCLGDIVLAYETMLREADEEGKTFADHFVHLVVHGTLHLLGHDHEDAGGGRGHGSGSRSQALARLPFPIPTRDAATLSAR